MIILKVTKWTTPANRRAAVIQTGDSLGSTQPIRAKIDRYILVDR